MRISFAWFDLWVGAYFDQRSRTWYVCPVPTILLTFPPKGDPQENPSP